MKCYIIDTLIGILAFDDNGNPLGFNNFNDEDQKIIEFYEALENGLVAEEIKKLFLELKDSGFSEFIFDNKKLKELVTDILGIESEYDPLSLEFRNIRFNLQSKLKLLGIEISREDISKKAKFINEALIKKKVSQVGAQNDVIIIQISETLEIIKKTISLLSSRIREWYGLHFPELTDKILEDNIVIAKLIQKLGQRENYTQAKINAHFDFKEGLKTTLIKKASESMGANIDLKLIQGFADQIISLEQYRMSLEENLDDLMLKTSPNIEAIIGSLIGAKLIAKAGGLKKLAFMPASRIQLLGAEKALYRFLKTGDKRPKHGLIFQWNLIRGSKPWIRGKISRIVAGKVGLAAKIDYFSGEFIGDSLAKEINEKIIEIEKKYPEPPKKTATKRAVSSKGKQKKRKTKR
ncbi:MAG: C/D box methylation guide ribonucleoprotein complex aNOP56 subunit [Promethearchaeota archaeon]